MAKYLDGTGLSHLWDKIKGLASGKVDKEIGKGLSSNDYTSAEKTKLEGVGTREAVTLSANKSLASGTISNLTNILSVELDPGVWVVVGQITFPGGSGTTQTMRRTTLSNTATGSNYGLTSISVINNAGVSIQVSGTVSFSTKTAIYLNASQNSGSSLTLASGVNNRLTAVRVA